MEFSPRTDFFDELELRPFNPLVTMFFTTGRFTGGALDLADKAGIIARNGAQLAVFSLTAEWELKKSTGHAVQLPEVFRLAEDLSGNALACLWTLAFYVTA